jgi:CHAT domain-containing protein/tetratricopeptide (TPR) repeat protein
MGWARISGLLAMVALAGCGDSEASARVLQPTEGADVAIAVGEPGDYTLRVRAEFDPIVTLEGGATIDQDRGLGLGELIDVSLAEPGEFTFEVSNGGTTAGIFEFELLAGPSSGVQRPSLEEELEALLRMRGLAKPKLTSRLLEFGFRAAELGDATLAFEAAAELDRSASAVLRARALYAQRDFEAAAEVLDRNPPVRGSPSELPWLVRSGHVARRRGDLETALSHFARALELARELELPGAEAYAAALLARYGGVEHEDMTEVALGALESPDCDPRDRAAATINLLRVNPEWPWHKAAALLEAALEPLAGTDEVFWIANLLLRLADGHVTKGSVPLGYRVHEELRELVGSRDLGPSRSLVARDLAKIAYRLGDFDRALRDLEIADQMASTIEESVQLSSRGLNLVTRGLILEDSGALLLAADAYARAADLGRTLKDFELQMLSSLNRARALRLSGGLVEAGEELDRAEELLQHAALADLGAHPYSASVDDGRVLLAFATGDLQRAEPFLKRVLDRYAEAGHKAAYLDALVYRARFALAQGDLESTVDCLADAEDRLGELGLLEVRAAAQARSRYSAWSAVSQELVGLRLALGDRDQDSTILAGWRQASQWKGRSLIEGLDGDFSGIASFGPADVQGAIGEHSALVEYCEGLHDLHAYLLVDGVLDRVTLGDLGSIEALARRYVRDVCETPRLRDPASVSALGGELSDSLLGPILERLPSETTGLVVVPSPGLATLPFQALVLEPGGPAKRPRFLADRFECSYAPSTNLLVQATARGARDSGPALLIGDPVFTNEEPAGGRYGRLRRLPATRPEVVRVVEWLIPEAERKADAVHLQLGRLQAAWNRGGRWSKPGLFDLYLGAEAHAGRLRGDLSRYRLIHAATHGLVEPFMPWNTGLVLSPDEHGQRLVDLAALRALRLDADLVVLSACDTARGRVLAGDGVQSIAAAFLAAGSRSVIASLWKVNDAVAKDVMVRFYAAYLEDNHSPVRSLAEASRSLRDFGGTRGVVPLQGVQQVDLSNAHPHVWAGFILLGAR